MAINDLYSDGLARGWNIRDASAIDRDETIETDVVIVGSGAGGGTAAEILSAAGLQVLMIEEGALYTSRDFKALDEFRSYSRLYQEAAGRATSDGAIPILQGRAVGGSTLVNWTTSIRTPAETLAYLAHTLTNRLIHSPTAAIRAAAEAGDRERLSALSRALHVSNEDKLNP